MAQTVCQKSLPKRESCCWAEGDAGFLPVKADSFWQNSLNRNFPDIEIHRNPRVCWDSLQSLLWFRDLEAAE